MSNVLKTLQTVATVVAVWLTLWGYVPDWVVAWLLAML